MKKRTILATLVASVTLVASFIVSAASGANATQGEAVIAGQTNSATGATSLAQGVACPFDTAALFGCGTDDGAVGYGNKGYGVGAVGANGMSTLATVGVGLTASGVTDAIDGKVSNDCCSAIYGLNSAAGNGVAGRADDGTGVLAASVRGTALKVDGKAQFSRSGTAAIVGYSGTPKSSIVVNNVAMTQKSIVLVTPQKNVPGVWIQAAVPNAANGRFTIFLNKTVTVSYPVAWFIVEKP